MTWEMPGRSELWRSGDRVVRAAAPPGQPHARLGDLARGPV